MPDPGKSSQAYPSWQNADWTLSCSLTPILGGAMQWVDMARLCILHLVDSKDEPYGKIHAAVPSVKPRNHAESVCNCMLGGLADRAAAFNNLLRGLTHCMTSHGSHFAPAQEAHSNITPGRSGPCTVIENQQFLTAS